jgi:hypothetical protein
LKTKLLRIALAVLATVGVGASASIAAAPAYAYRATSSATLTLGSTKYTMQTYNTSMAKTHVNSQCYPQSWWSKNALVTFKTSSRKVITKQNLEFYHAAYLYDYYFMKKSHRHYSSVAAYKKDLARVNALSLTKVKTSLGIYCLRDTRRQETKGKVANLAKQLNGYIRIHPDTTTVNNSMVDLNAYETYHSFKQSYTVNGNASAYIITGCDLSDHYAWVYDSGTGTYAESKL